MAENRGLAADMHVRHKKPLQFHGSPTVYTHLFATFHAKYSLHSPAFPGKKALSVRAVFIFAELKYRLPVLACLPVQKKGRQRSEI